MFESNFNILFFLVKQMNKTDFCYIMFLEEWHFKSWLCILVSLISTRFFSGLYNFNFSSKLYAEGKKDVWRRCWTNNYEWLVLVTSDT